MKKIFRNCLAAAAVLLAAVTMASCSTKSSTPSALIEQSQRIDGELSSLAANSPHYLAKAGAAYADGILSVDITFADAAVVPADYSQALVEYAVSAWLKTHLGVNLDTTLNTLSAEKGSLKITLAGADGTTKDFTIGSARLKKLLVIKPSELGFSEVKDNVALIMEKRCAEYKDAYKATEASFEITGGFAQYTLVFESASMFSNLNQDSLRGRYQKVLQAQYANYGECAPFVTDIIKSLGIDGYRFVYEGANDASKTLKAALPWRLFE